MKTKHSIPRKISLIAGFAGTLGFGVWLPGAARAWEGFVYTANEGGNSISAIDVGTRKVENLVTPITPHNVQVSRDGQLLLFVGSVPDITATREMTDAGKMARGRLLIIDAETLNEGTRTRSQR